MSQIRTFENGRLSCGAAELSQQQQDGAMKKGRMAAAKGIKDVAARRGILSTHKAVDSLRHEKCFNWLLRGIMYDRFWPISVEREKFTEHAKLLLHCRLDLCQSQYSGHLVCRVSPQTMNHGILLQTLNLLPRFDFVDAFRSCHASIFLFTPSHCGLWELSRGQFSLHISVSILAFSHLLKRYFLLTIPKVSHSW